ncbi:MAG: ClbS/DfsB family four-helix bundle protein [Anaerolineae bacterium]|nr:ClbS/DfsB family four-helix bundle protein [Anaerolineae bacterium]
MTEQIISKSELMEKIHSGWDKFQTYIGTLSDKQLTIPSDAAGWTIKDHIMHLAVWEDGIYALLEKQPRDAQMGIETETWLTGDYDHINDIIQKRFHDKPLDEVLQTFKDVHTRIMQKLESMTEADLARPYSDYQSGTDLDTPVVEWVISNTYEHYAEHQPWIAKIAARG